MPLFHSLPIGQIPDFNWDFEPIVSNYKKITYQNQTMNKEFNVPISATPIIVPGHGVIVCSDEGYIRFFKEDFSEIFWELRAKEDIYSTPIFDSPGFAFIVSTSKGNIFKIDLNGNILWHTNLKNPIYGVGKICYRTNNIYLSGFNQKGHILNNKTGKEKKRIDLPSPWYNNFPTVAGHRDPYAGPALTKEGNVLFTNGEFLTCVSSEGEILWKNNITHIVKSTPAVSFTRDLGILGNVRGEIILFRPETGEILKNIKTNAKIIHSPAISKDIAVIANELGEIFGIDLITCEIKWTYKLNSEMLYTSFTTLPNGNFIFNSKRGNIYCLGQKNGEFLWETSQVLGLEEHEPNMDTTPICGNNGLMYCTSYSGFVYQFRFKGK